MFLTESLLLVFLLVLLNDVSFLYPFIFFGISMLNGYFSPWPSFTEEEAQAVQRVLLSNQVNYWTGQEGRQFEREFAQFAESEYAIAVSNGTTALDLALKGLGIGEGEGQGRDEVIVTSRTFLASASSIVNAGAVPVFADVDADSQNITADTVAAKITPNTRAKIGRAHV